jgi:hypothetical protein
MRANRFSQYFSRGHITLLNWGLGAAMLCLAWGMHVRVAFSDSSDCTTEAGSYCGAGEGCCNGACFDPTHYVCACDGELHPIDEE